MRCRHSIAPGERHPVRVRPWLFVTLGVAILGACGDSPSGPRNDGPEQIAFSAGGAIHVVDADGSNRRSITQPAGSWDPEWSPDGSRIVFSGGSGDDRDLWTVAADGTGLRRLTATPDVDQSPSWSPDGKQIVFMRGYGIHVMNADGTGVRQLTGRVDLNDDYPDWSPDGTQVIFERVSTGGDPRSGVFIMNADGTEQRMLLEGGRDPAWSPDGRSIAFTRRDGTGRHLQVMSADGTGVRELSTPSRQSDYNPAWSHDGRRIAFMSDAAADVDSWLDIFVIDADGTNLRALTRDRGMESYPSWRPR